MQEVIAPRRTPVAVIPPRPTIDDRLFWLAVLVAVTTQLGPAVDRAMPDSGLGTALVAAAALVAVSKVGRPG